ncbi:MAG: cupin domain-containing protein [Actinobacteria bacterium]|nr:MAG: cupin domain-containing protein [Actinomycetota bacterium]
MIIPRDTEPELESVQGENGGSMSDYTIKHIAEVQDVLGDYPGEMRMMTGDLGSEQVAFTYRRMPRHTGGKGSYGHRHKEQEEVYFVASGKLQFKLGDDVVELEKGNAVRVAPETWRSVCPISSRAAQRTTPSSSRTSGRSNQPE